jgi:CheY-like chemotaxis protein
VSEIRRGRVLVIDDEAILGRSLARALRPHEVTLLVSGDAGLARLREGELPDLVLCDLMMPGFSGMDLYEALVACRPEALERLVFMTGGSFSEECDRFIEEHAVVVLTKPFEPRAVDALLARVLGR